MKRIFLLFVVVTLCLPGLTQDLKYSRVKINLDQSDLKHIAKAGIPLDDAFIDKKENTLTLEISQHDINKLNALGISIDVMVDDVSEWYVNRNAGVDMNAIMQNARSVNSDYPVPTDFTLGTCGGFSTIEQCYEHLDNMSQAYPELITIRQPIADYNTYNNREVFYVKISDNPNDSEDEPQVLYTGMHHAREPIGMQHLMYYMYYLLENYNINDDIKQLVDNTEMYFVLIVNPDGYARNIQTNATGGGMWRKNRVDNSDGSFGVDLNRNYGYFWGYDDEGSSPIPYTETYRGEAPFSELETMMLKEFCEAHNFKIALNYHSYSNLLLYPWGYIPQMSEDEDVFNLYSKNMTAENHYVYGPGSTTIYPSNGGSDDWMYGEQTTKEKILSYTPEVGTQADGFWPSVSRIIPLCQENMLQSILAARYSGAYGELIDQTPLIVSDNGLYVSFDLTRLGQTASTYTVSLEPLSDNIATIADPLEFAGMEVLTMVSDSIPFTLKDGVKSGDTIRYVLVLNDGYITYRDTTERYFGTPVILFSDDLTTSANWTGDWGLSTLFPFSPPSSMTDSPSGNYSNYTLSSVTLNEEISLHNASVAVLSFYARWRIEAGYDYVQLLISNDDGSSWTPLEGRYTKPGTMYQTLNLPVYDDVSYWVKEEINLSEYAGEDIKLRFTLRSDEGVTADGFYFDDVEISMIDRTVNTPNVLFTEKAYLSEGYPNPAQEQVSFNYKVNQSAGASMVISDLQGRVLKTTPLNSTEGILRINTSELKAGMYICTLMDQNQMKVSRKIIK